MILRRPRIDIGSNPSRFLGAYYGVAPYFFEKRPMITLHLIWWVVWIMLPFERYRRMWTDMRYGWHCSLRRGDPIKNFVRADDEGLAPTKPEGRGDG